MLLFGFLFKDLRGFLIFFGLLDGGKIGVLEMVLYFLWGICLEVQIYPKILVKHWK